MRRVTQNLNAMESPDPAYDIDWLPFAPGLLNLRTVLLGLNPLLYVVIIMVFMLGLFNSVSYKVLTRPQRRALPSQI